MRPPAWQSAIEIHPSGWVCPAAGRFWIAGWIAAPGLVPVDVRARLADRVFLGLCGLPRPDKEIAVHGRAGPPQAGFSFLLDPVAGACEIQLEACDQFGRWTVFFRHPFICPGVVAPLPPAVPSAQTFLRLLRIQHQRPRESWRSLATEIVVAEQAVTFDVMPSVPFHGALEELGDRAAVQYDHLLVTGWIAHREQRIVSLTAFLDTAIPLPLVHGLPRPDAGALFGDLVNADHSRFTGWLPIPPTVPRPLALRIFAQLADGRTELVFLKRFQPVVTSGRGTDLPPFSPAKAIAATWALRRAGVPPPLRAAWRDYQLAAPVTQRLAPAPKDPPPTAIRPLRVTLVTHNLNYEGAPLFLLEYARHLAAQPSWDVRLVSICEGPLRAAFASAGITVIVAKTFDANTDVIIANTLESHWAVPLAHRLQKACLFYIHESASARRFFALRLSQPELEEVERAFTLATRVVFIADAARRAHAALDRQGNFRVLPGWIDIARIQTYAATHSRSEVRRRLGLPEDAIVFANIGSLLPRKGQQIFIEAIARLQAAKPAEPLVFWLVGAQDGPDPYADLLRRAVATPALASVRIITRDADPYQYFHAADIFVCSSLEEALPRVVMEAALFGRLIVSTNVDGIPEMLGPEEAWLVPPADAANLAAAMQAALAAHQRSDFSRGERARTKVAACFDAAVLLPRHIDLLRTVAEIPLT